MNEASGVSRGRTGEDAAFVDKVLAFFGDDLVHVPAGTLKDYFNKGYALVCLDVAAIGIASREAVPFTVIDDWVSPERLIQARNEAEKAKRTWYRAERPELTSNGVCWPEFDSEAMQWFWPEVFVAFALAAAFRERRVGEVIFWQELPNRPQLYYKPSDVAAAIIREELGDAARVVVRTPHKSRTCRPRWLGFLLRSIGRIRGSVSKQKRNIADHGQWPGTASGNSVVMAINAGEYFRFAHLVRELADKFGKRFVLVLINASEIVADAARQEHGIPVLRPHMHSGGSPDNGDHYLRAVRRLQAAAMETAAESALRTLDFHFKFYCATRWPMLDRQLDYWRKLWTTARPAGVIVSGLADSESQLPAQAAKSLSIPTFSIPHGAGFTRQEDRVAADHVLFDLGIQQAIYQESGVEPSRLIPVRDVTVVGEYPSSRSDRPKSSAAFKILVVTHPIGMRGCIAPNTGPRAQLRALRALSCVPSDLLGRIEVSIKVNPNPAFADLELFHSSEPRRVTKLHPVDASLEQLLPDADLVIALNYCGGALVHAIRAHKPILFFWSDRLTGKCAPTTFGEWYLGAGELVRDEEGLWASIRDLSQGAESKAALSARARRFCSEQLDNHADLTVAEVIRHRIDAGITQRIEEMSLSVANAGYDPALGD